MPIQREQSDGSGSGAAAKRPREVANTLPVVVPAVVVPANSIPQTLPGILSLSQTDLEQPTLKTLIRLYAAVADLHGKVQIASAAIVDAHGKIRTASLSLSGRHCVRCHKDFDEAFNGQGACIIEHDNDSKERLKRVYKGSRDSIWVYRCCGQEVKSESPWDCDEDIQFCFKGPHTRDPEELHFDEDGSYDEYGSTKTCEELNCEVKYWDEPGTDEDDED